MNLLKQYRQGFREIEELHDRILDGMTEIKVWCDNYPTDKVGGSARGDSILILAEFNAKYKELSELLGTSRYTLARIQSITTALKLQQDKEILPPGTMETIANELLIIAKRSQSVATMFLEFVDNTMKPLSDRVYSILFTGQIS